MVPAAATAALAPRWRAVVGRPATSVSLALSPPVVVVVVVADGEGDGDGDGDLDLALARLGDGEREVAVGEFDLEGERDLGDPPGDRDRRRDLRWGDLWGQQRCRESKMRRKKNT